MAVALCLSGELLGEGTLGQSQCKRIPTLLSLETGMVSTNDVALQEFMQTHGVRGLLETDYNPICCMRMERLHVDEEISGPQFIVFHYGYTLIQVSPHGLARLNQYLKEHPTCETNAWPLGLVTSFETYFSKDPKEMGKLVQPAVKAAKGTGKTVCLPIASELFVTKNPEFPPRSELAEFVRSRGALTVSDIKTSDVKPLRVEWLGIDEPMNGPQFIVMNYGKTLIQVTSHGLAKLNEFLREHPTCEPNSLPKGLTTSLSWARQN